MGQYLRTTVLLCTILAGHAGMAANTAPIASPQTLTTPAETPISITLNGTDPDNNSLTFQIKTQPLKGILSGTPPQMVYTAEPAYSGAVSFTFVANDGTVDSPPATVSIAVTYNRPPTIQIQTPAEGAVLKSRKSINLTATTSDPDNNPVSVNYKTQL